MSLKRENHMAPKYKPGTAINSIIGRTVYVSCSGWLEPNRANLPME